MKRVPFVHLRRVAGIAGVALFLAAGCNDGGATVKNPDSPTGDTVADAGPTPDVGTDGDSETDTALPPPPGVPSSIETEITNRPVRAGEPLQVDCKLVDRNGEPVSVDETPEYYYNYSPRDAFEQNDAGALVPTTKVEAQLACTAPSLSLVDDSPAEFTVRAGDPHTVRTSLDPQQMTAGDTARASCEVFDEYGNAIEDFQADVGLDEMGSGISISGRDLTVEDAGEYMATCQVSGASETYGAALEVNPGLPDSISMTPVPSKSVYETGEVVRFAVGVQDQYGNDVPAADLAWTVQPSASRLGLDQWEFATEGTYEVSVVVDQETRNDKDLSARTEIVVDDEGPAITCRDPGNGTYVDADPGSSITFQGKVEDAHAIDDIRVAGNTVQPNSNGQFSYELDVDYGVNFVDITATDEYGSENSTTCAFLAADSWHDDGDKLSDAVNVAFQEDALDDGTRWDSLDSLADIVDSVLNSDGLLHALDERLKNANPLRQGDVDIYYIDKDGNKNHDGSRSPTPEPGLEIGDTEISLGWTTQGFEIGSGSPTELQSVRIRLDTETAWWIPCAPSFWANVDRIEVQGLETELYLEPPGPRGGSGTLRARAIENSGSIDAYNPTIDSSGVCGDLASWVANNFFQGDLQNIIERELRTQLENNIDTQINDLFERLEPDSLSGYVTVPTLDSNGDIYLSTGFSFSNLDTDGSRLLVGLGTRFEPLVSSYQAPAKGVALPEGDVRNDPSTSDAIAASAHVGVLNHALHALWRGGLFEADIGQGLLGSSVPDGTQANLEVQMAPVAEIQQDGSVHLQLGGARVDLVYPGVFDDPVTFRVGMVADTGASIQGADTLEFDNITLEEFYMAPEGVSLDDESRQLIESFLRGLFQKVVDDVLNSSLPALPIPSFTIPPSLDDFGLNAGDDLGLTSATVDPSSPHFTVEGNFGIQ